MATEPTDPYREVILTPVRERGAGKSACPSEVARAVAPDDWRNRMQVVRAAARVLAQAGHLRITQGDDALDPEGPCTGPIRLRLS